MSAFTNLAEWQSQIESGSEAGGFHGMGEIEAIRTKS